MSLSTANTSTPEDRKAKVAKLREYHQPIFDALGIPDALFMPKMAYPYKGENHMSFFPSELTKGADIYTECVSREYQSEDPERNLYKWKYNPHFRDEYARTDENNPSKSRFLIPMAELIKIDKEAVIQVKEFEIPDPDSDPLISHMTIRDLAAILWKKGVSRKKWLNDLITKTK